MKTKPFTIITIVLLSLVCLTHVLRLLYGWEVTVDTWVMPLWLSVFGFVITGGLAFMTWREM